MNVTITTGATGAVQPGNITVANAIGKTAGGNATLTLTLSQANTYTGSTTISNGTLAVSANNALPSGTSVIVNGGGLAIGSTSNRVAGVQLLSGGLSGGTGVLTSTSDYDLRAGTVTANLAGAVNLNKSTGGTVALSGSCCTYTGVTNIDAGTLTTNASIPNNGAVSIASGATLGLVGTGEIVGSISGAGNISLGALNLTAGQSNATTTFSGVISGTGNFTKPGTGTLTLSGANTYSGTTTITGGTLAIDGAAATAGAGSIVVGANTLDIRNGATISNAVTINGGTIANSAGTGTLGTGGLTLLGNATLSSAGTGLDVTSVITDGASTFGLTKTGASTVTLAAANTYDGATSVSAGTLAVTNAAGLGSTTGATTVASGATLDLRNVAVGAEAVTLNGGTLATSTGTSSLSGGVTLTANSTVDVTGTQLTASGVVTDGAGTFGLAKNGAGTLILSNANTYDGATSVNAGTLAVVNAAALGSITGGTAVAAGATLDLRNVAVGAEAVTLNGGTLAASTGISTLSGTVALAADSTLDAGGTQLTLSGVMSGAGGFTKTGAGELVLSGAKTFSGNTQINQGVVTASHSSALGSTAGVTSVANGATLNINNVAIGAEAVTLNGNGASPAGALTASGTAALAGNVTLASASRIGTTSGVSTLTLGGAVNAAGNALDIAGTGSVTATTNAANDFGTVTITGAKDVALKDANAISLGASTLTGTLNVQAAGTLTLTGNVSATGAGDAITLAAGRFVNTAGATALATPTGGARWLVWSANPSPFSGGTPDDRGGLAFDFKQYNATFGVTTVAQATGNGFLYSLAPTITPTLTGTITKVYDGNNTATLAGTNYTSGGVVDSDTVTLNNPVAGTYSDKNAALGKNVAVTGISITSVTNGAATVYGYTLGSTTANANIGDITQKALTATAAAPNKIYDGATTAAPPSASPQAWSAQKPSPPAATAPSTAKT